VGQIRPSILRHRVPAPPPIFGTHTDAHTVSSTAIKFDMVRQVGDMRVSMGRSRPLSTGRVQACQILHGTGNRTIWWENFYTSTTPPDLAKNPSYEWWRAICLRWLTFMLHRASEAAAQCIVIAPVCGFVCMWGVCGSVTTITRNCVHRSSPNWVCR